MFSKQVDRRMKDTLCWPTSLVQGDGVSCSQLMLTVLTSALWVCRLENSDWQVTQKPPEATSPSIFSWAGFIDHPTQTSPVEAAHFNYQILVTPAGYWALPVCVGLHLRELRKHYLNKWFSIGVILPPGHIWQCLDSILIASLVGGCI